MFRLSFSAIQAEHGHEHLTMEGINNMHHRTHLEHLLHSAMLQLVPDVVHECCRQWREQGKTGDPDRTTLVQHLLQQVGPSRFLDYCEEFPSYAPSSPLFFLLYNSSTPGSMIKKISLHAPHFHPTRRLELVEEGKDYVVIEDVFFSGPPPLPADDMFVCSTLKGVLNEYGCRGIQVEWEAVRSPQLEKTLRTINIQPLAMEKFTRWRYHWDRIERSCRIDGMDEFCLEKINASESIPTDSLLFRLQRLLEGDLSQRPSIDATALKLGLTPRTLQRKLMDEGTSYSKLHNELRLKAAEKLLLATNMTLAEIGRFSGFTDSAHLCREFNKRYQTTPRNFRKRRGHHYNDLSVS